MDYCGRAVTREQREKEGKYKLPGNFAKQEVVYNLHRLKAPVELLIVVESYISVWKLSQADFRSVVALMGLSIRLPPSDLPKPLSESLYQVADRRERFVRSVGNPLSCFFSVKRS